MFSFASSVSLVIILFSCVPTSLNHPPVYMLSASSTVCHHVLPRSVCNHCLLFCRPWGSFLVLFWSSLEEQFPRLRDGHLKVSLDVWCPLSCFLSRTVSKSSEVRPQGGQSMLHVVFTALGGSLRSFSCWNYKAAASPMLSSKVNQNLTKIHFQFSQDLQLHRERWNLKPRQPPLLFFKSGMRNSSSY